MMMSEMGLSGEKSRSIDTRNRYINPLTN